MYAIIVGTPELPTEGNGYSGTTYISMTQLTQQDQDFHHLQRAKRRMIRRRVRIIVTMLVIAFVSIGLAALAWQVFVMRYARP